MLNNHSHHLFKKNVRRNPVVRKQQFPRKLNMNDKIRRHSSPLYKEASTYTSWWCNNSMDIQKRSCTKRSWFNWHINIAAVKNFTCIMAFNSNASSSWGYQILASSDLSFILTHTIPSFESFKECGWYDGSISNDTRISTATDTCKPSKRIKILLLWISGKYSRVHQISFQIT